MSGSEDYQLNDILCWPGKSSVDRGGLEHPAALHMLDVAAVAETLLPPQACENGLRQALLLLIALHDLGKFSESFRKMLRGEVGGQTYRHWQISEVYFYHFDALLSSFIGGDMFTRAQLYAAVAGHHGRPSDLNLHLGQGRVRGGDQAKALALAGGGVAAAEEVIKQFAALWPLASVNGMTLETAKQLSWWLSGLCTAADWIGSNTTWFAPQAGIHELGAYLAGARLKAVHAVGEAGLMAAPVRSAPWFTSSLRPMQAACQHISLPEGPMLAVIEDETGAGKTEAALLLAQRMLVAGKGQGLFFALPTMATADAMFARATQAVGKIFDSPRVTLAHGRAGLSIAFKDVLAGTGASPDDVTCSEWLGESRRRALLADVGVGTVDQALLAVLPVKFQALRHYALASKILIVDEVHELGEPYIGKELEALLSVHRAAGGSAILLTATLPIAQRKRLLAVYGGAAQSAAYPALTVAGGDAITDLPQETGPKGAVRIERISAMAEAVALIAAKAKVGAACVWVRNAVDDAIAAFEALEAEGVEVELLHARFALGDRKQVEAGLLGRFGKTGQGRAGRVLIGTQVLESSLDFDFDVMVSDLAPMAALIQRAGRLWRHMSERPRSMRPVAEPVLYVLSPDPAAANDENWLKSTLGGGAYVYPISDQWRTADVLFNVQKIVAPSGLRALIEAVHGAQARTLPAGLQAAELTHEGVNAGKRSHADHNIVDFVQGYRAGGRADDEARYPTRLGEEQRVLMLVRETPQGLRPWIGGEDGWALSELSASARKLQRLPLPDQSAAAIKALKADWPEWKQHSVTVCPVIGPRGDICEGLRYEARLGLIFGNKS